MKKSILILLLVLIMLLCGCSTEKNAIPLDRPTTALVIIAGKHANANNFYDEMLDQAKTVIETAVDYRKEGSVYTAELDLTVIVSDGDPRAEKLQLKNGSNLKTTANNKEMILSNVESLVTAVVNALASDDVRAKEQGVDLQGALNQARKILRMSNADRKHILIMDTGISTEGHLDMRQLKLMEGTLEEVMERIDPGTFPNLEDIEITFLGMGNIAAPQMSLGNSSDDESRFEKFWAMYLEDKCGGTLLNDPVFLTTDGEVLSCDEYLENPYPYVPVVSFELPKPITVVNPGENTETEIVDYGPLLPPIFSAEIGFKGDSDVFRDEAHAMEVVSKRAKELEVYFAQNPGKIVYIVGSAAKSYDIENGTPDDHIAKIRAQRICDILVSRFGFAESQFVVIDGGSQTFSWRNNPDFVNGEKRPENQMANRLVALIAETDVIRVQELIDAGEILVEP